MFHVEPFVENINLKGFPELEWVKITPKEPTRIGNIEIGIQSFVVPKICYENVELLYKFNVRKDDVWITTFPKCGTTWMQEMCWLILNNYDFEAAKQTELEFRSAYFDYNTIVPTNLFNPLEILGKFQSPRVIKTHLSVGFLPADLWSKNAKIIHVVRDPRDAAVSQYHMQIGQGLHRETLEKFLKNSIEGQSNFSLGTFWHHNLSLWKLRHNSNYLFVTFEEMKKDLPSVIKKVCTFLSKPITDEQLTKMLEHLSFESMKNNESLNHNVEANIVALLTNRKNENFRFMRKGDVGSHKSELSTGFSEFFNDWVRENLKDSDFDLYLKS